MKILRAVLVYFFITTFSLIGSDFDFDTTRYPCVRLPDFIEDFYYHCKETIKEFHHTITQIPTTFSHILFPQHPYQMINAHVRTQEKDALCLQEKLFQKKRLPLIQKSLNDLGISCCDKTAPTIAFCFSGGGIRAKLLTLGFLCAAQETGLLQTSMYCAGLSGSTWALATLIASKKDPREVLDIFSKTLTYGIQPCIQNQSCHEIVGLILHKLANKQLVSAIDIYGCLLANTLLAPVIKNPLKTTLTQTHLSEDHHLLPLPIYTAIAANTLPYQWVEVTPFELGFSMQDAYIPTWSYGRKFKDGVSQNYCKEQTLGIYMGIFGSAFEVSLYDIVKMTAQSLITYRQTLSEAFDKALKDSAKLILNSCVGQARPFPSMLPNFTYRMKNKPLQQEKTLCLVDAGIDCNIPLLPLLRNDRKVDLIIVYDASASVEDGCEFEKACEFAKKYEISLPPIHVKDVHTKTLTMWHSNNPKEPTIIYMPRIKNKNYKSDFDPDVCIKDGYCNTFNFTYKKEEVEELAGLSYFTLKQHTPLIKKIIQMVAYKKARLAT